MFGELDQSYGNSLIPSDFVHRVTGTVLRQGAPVLLDPLDRGILSLRLLDLRDPTG